MKAHLKLIAAVLIALGGIATDAYSNSISYTTTLLGNNPHGDAGQSHSYTAGGITITAYAFDVSSTVSGLHLYGKNSTDNGTASEQGLGLTRDVADHEIDGSDFIQLDLINLVNAGYTQFSVQLGSLQANETGKVSLDTTAGTIGDALGWHSQTGGDIYTTTFTLSATNHYIDITGGGNDGSGVGTGDVLINSFTVSQHVPDTVPTAMMLGLAMAVLISFRRKFSHN